jgi:hypothetical protein
MVYQNSSYGFNNPLNNIFPYPIVAQRAPKTTDVNYPYGQIWVDQSTDTIYGLSNINSGAADWEILGGSGSDVNSLTGDTGGAISPSSGNINILGGDGLTVAGSGSTLTINRDAEGGYPITPYVVGASGEAGYTTIQDGLDAANAAGGGLVFVQGGSYTEDLTLYDAVHILGATYDSVTITGTHTPPTSGTISIEQATLVDATAIFSSAAAGTTTITLDSCDINVTNGFLFNLDNWTGTLQCFHVGTIGTSDGFLTNTGGATVICSDSDLGIGSGQTLVLDDGSFTINYCDLKCPSTLGGATTFVIDQGSEITGTFTTGGTSSGTIDNSGFSTGATAAISQGSSGTFSLTNSTITSSNSPAIDGAGSGVMTIGNVVFTSNSEIAATLTIGTADLSTASAFRTNILATGVTYSANNIDATGSDTDISITMTPKGTGTFTVDSGGISVTDGDIINSHSDAAADVTIEVTNSDNTDLASRAGIEMAVGGTSAGDPYANFLISGGQAFTMGIDNSTTNDDFVISNNAALGTSNAISIDGSSLDVSVSTGNLQIASTGKGLQIKGGAVTDFVGTATLSGGTINVANTNILTGDIIFISYIGTGLSNTGQLSYVINTGASFDINSTNASDTNNVSYMVVRPT